MKSEDAFLILALTVLLAFIAGWQLAPTIEGFLHPAPHFTCNGHFC